MTARLSIRAQRILSVFTLLAGSVALPFSAGAQDYPDDTIEVVVAYAPGGSTDLVARTLAEKLGEALDTSVVVDNRPGGGTLVGTQHVANSDPNGYRLLFGTNALVINSLLQPVEYDPVDSFSDVAVVTTQSLAIVARPDFAPNTVEELIAYAKEHPGEVNFASSGNGSNQHMAGEQFKLMAGVDMLHIPYGGAGPALTDMLGGRADVMFTSLFGITEYIEGGQLKLIATTGDKRNPATPDTPTVAESGLPGYSAISWQALEAPAGTPDEIINELNAALVEVSTSELAETLAAQGLELAVSTPEEANELLKSEREKYRGILSSIGLGTQ